jgi:hypothetical protein
VKRELLFEDDQDQHGVKEFIMSSGITANSLLQEAVPGIVNAGLESDFRDFTAGKCFVVYNVPGHIAFDWGAFAWTGKQLFSPIGLQSGKSRSYGSVDLSPIALSRLDVDELCDLQIGCTAIYSATVANADQFQEYRQQLDMFPFKFADKILFFQKMEFRTRELPRWKPRVNIDPSILERVNE